MSENQPAPHRSVFERLSTWLAAIAGMASASASAAPPGQPPPIDDRPVDGALVITVYDYSGMFADGERPRLCLGASLNGWDPAWAPAQKTFAAAGDAPGGWRLSIGPAALGGHTAFEFKLTRGTWGTVEVAIDGSDIPNRRAAGVSIPGALEVSLHGFADQFREGGAAAGSTVTGDLDVFPLHSKILGNRRSVRVWLPPGYHDEANAARRYPVFYMNDGQNLFDAATSFAGEWGMDETATALIEAGEIPPLIVVGVDNAGVDRAVEYNPSSTRLNDRDGHGERYLDFIETELMPQINADYRTLTDKGHTGFGGSSFGGNITLLAAMTRPQLFSRYLVESPAAQHGKAFLARIMAHESWSGRMFVAMGTVETGEAERDAELVRAAEAIAEAMHGAGLDGDHLRLTIGRGDRHHESAWARRLPEAMRFLWGRP